MFGTYFKLRNGAWGVKTDPRSDISPDNDGLVERGDVVFVLTRAGDLKSEIVRKVLFTDDRYFFCSIETGSRKRRVEIYRNGDAYGHLNIPAHVYDRIDNCW